MFATGSFGMMMTCFEQFSIQVGVSVNQSDGKDRKNLTPSCWSLANWKGVGR